MFVVVPLLFFIPGLLVCAACGIRGWRLAAVAPAVTFGLAAAGGPLLNALGVRWSVPSFAVWTFGVAVVAFAATWLWARLRPGTERAATQDDDRSGPLRRARWEHLTVGAGVLLGMG